MGIKSKSPKGEIVIENYRGRIRLRWRYNGIRYPLNLPLDYTSENLHKAEVKAAEIKLDIIKGCFDTTLGKYKVQRPKPVIPPQVQENITIPHFSFLHQLTDNFKDWTKNIRNINIDHSVDYYGVYRALLRWKSIPLERVAVTLKNESWSVSTYNKRLNMLQGFFDWMKDSGSIATNPLMHVIKRSDKQEGNKKQKNARRTPLSVAEIQVFLEAIRLDTFCHQCSPVKHSFYYPFLKFIFLTGVRNAEAVGLKVKHIDFALSRLEVSEAFARTVKGSNHAARLQKGTKTDNVRYLPITDELKELLLSQVPGRRLDDFVFISPQGLSIDDRMLQRRVIKPVLKAIGLGDKDLYVARHSFGTRAVQQGIPLTDVAYLMGHATIETAIKNYVHTDKPAVALPVMVK